MPDQIQVSPVEAQLKSAYDRFLTETEPARKRAAGHDFIRTIFGRDALAIDSAR